MILVFSRACLVDVNGRQHVHVEMRGRSQATKLFRGRPQIYD